MMDSRIFGMEYEDIDLFFCCCVITGEEMSNKILIPVTKTKIVNCRADTITDLENMLNIARLHSEQGNLHSLGIHPCDGAYVEYYVQELEEKSGPECLLHTFRKQWMEGK